MKNILFTSTEKAESAGYIWNTLSGLIMAGQSVLLLIVITRVCGLKTAGVFSIAYAIANLMLTIGKYGMRNYQVSDVRTEFSFHDYLWSRIATSTAMVIFSTGYACFGIFASGYDANKVLVIILFCLLKTVDAVEDVYFGLYQKKGRLDVGAKAMTFRLSGTLFVLVLAVTVTRELILSTAITCIFSSFLCIWMITTTYSYFREKEKSASFQNVRKLLWECFPLFAGGYLSIYIGNISKYAIDKYMSEEIQACYNFVFMPVFVVGLISGFAFQPVISKMAVLWKNGDHSGFARIILEQLAIVFVILAVVLAGAGILGIPILSLLYNTDLTPYRGTLMILLIGGGFNAAAVFYTVVLTVIRRQKAVIWGYFIVAVLSKAASGYFVPHYGINGAAVLYLITMGTVMIAFGCCTIFYQRSSTV